MANLNTRRTMTFKPNDRIPVSWAQKVENFISTFRVLSGGQFIFDGRNAVLQCFGSAGGSFNGKAYTPAGRLYEDLTDTTKLYVKYDLSTGIITEEVGPPAEPWGVNETWRKKSDFSGSIYF